MTNNMKLGNHERDARIDYLKGLAMILIVLLHSIQMVDGLPEVIRKPILLGQVGVQLFLLCSGYLVIKPFAEMTRTFDLHKGFAFLRKKYVSLAVPFVIFLLIYLTINYLFSLFQIELPYKNNTGMISILLNVFLVHGLFPFCLNNVVPGGWYVGTLLILFGITPIIIRFIKNANHLMIAAAVVALISVIISLILHFLFAVDTSNGSFFYFSFFNQAPAYLVGMSLAIDDPKASVSLKRYILYDGAIAITILALFYFELPFSYAVIPILSALLFADIYTLLSSLPTLIKKTRWICRIGQNTYAIYLSHFILAWYVPLVMEKFLRVTGVVQLIITLCMCAVLCIASPYISLPLNRLTKRIEIIIAKG